MSDERPLTSMPSSSSGGFAMAASTSNDLRRNLMFDLLEMPETFEVFLRIRPPTPDECKNWQPLMSYAVDGKKLKVMPGIGNICHEFTFSNIMDCKTTQSEVFDTTTLAAVHDFVAGQNCIVFSYGVTNSGKTFTMQGTPTDPGVIPRALDMIFQSISDRLNKNPMQFKPQNGGVIKLAEKDVAEEGRLKKSVLRLSNGPNEVACISLMESLNASSWKNLTSSTTINLSDASRASVASLRSSIDVIDDEGLYSVWISFIEIYNEKVYDLLSSLKPSYTGYRLTRPDLKLQENREGRLFVKGVREICVDAVDEALQLLLIGQQNLQVASTKLNYASSRSHAIYTIKLVRVVNAEDSNEAHVSQLCFCDLAGSERTDKTQNVGSRLKEAGIINSSLLVLSRCVTALRHNQLATNEATLPVPFRDSKLTRFFQSFFTGRGKAFMIVSVSPIANLANETMHVLRFSAIAKDILLPQTLEFLSNPTKVTKLSLDLLRHSLDGGRSIAWETPCSKMSTSPPSSPSMMVGHELGSHVQRCSEVLFEEDENEDDDDNDGGDADDEKRESDDDSDDEKDAKLRKYYDVIQTLRDMVIKEHREKLGIELKIREQVGNSFMAMMDKQATRHAERIESDAELAEEVYGRLIEDQAVYFKKQLQYKQNEIDSLPSVESLDALKLKVESLESTLAEVQKTKENVALEWEEKYKLLQEQQLVVECERIKTLEEEVLTLHDQLAAQQSSVPHETLYETVMAHGSSDSESGTAVQEANRKWSLLYTNVAAATAVGVDGNSSVSTYDDVFHDVISTPHSVVCQQALFFTASSDDDDVDIPKSDMSRQEEDVAGSILDEDATTSLAVDTTRIIETPPCASSRSIAGKNCNFEQMTELCAADIDKLFSRTSMSEEKIVELEATVAKLDEIRRCLEIQKVYSFAQIAALQEDIARFEGVTHDRCDVSSQTNGDANADAAIMMEMNAQLDRVESAKQKVIEELTRYRQSQEALVQEMDTLRAKFHKSEKECQETEELATLECNELEEALQKERVAKNRLKEKLGSMLKKRKSQRKNIKQLTVSLKEATDRNKLLHLELGENKSKPIRKQEPASALIFELSESDSDFENVPEYKPRVPTDKRRLRKAIKGDTFEDSSDSSILLTDQATSAKKETKSSYKSVKYEQRKHNNGVKQKRTMQALAKTNVEVVECSPCSSPEKLKPTTKNLVRRVLRPRK